MAQSAHAGRLRLPTKLEDADPNTVFYPNAVLELRPTSEVLPPLERHVASFIDGFRPVARIKKKAGLSSDELIDALRALRERGLLVLTGIVEATDDAVDDGDVDPEATMPRGAGDMIPPHVMAEIDLMLEEEMARQNAEDGGADDDVDDEIGNVVDDGTDEQEIPS